MVFQMRSSKRSGHGSGSEHHNRQFIPMVTERYEELVAEALHNDGPFIYLSQANMEPKPITGGGNAGSLRRWAVW